MRQTNWMPPVLGFGFIVGIAALTFCLSPLLEKEGGHHHSILRNWSEYGFWSLGGKAVLDAGGPRAGEEPSLFSGHSRLQFMLVYGLERLAPVGTPHGLAAYLALTLVITFSVWTLLGRDAFALAVACAIPLSPGYIRGMVAIDTLVVPVMLGFPVAAWLVSQMRKVNLTKGSWCAIATVILLYTAVDWTTAFAFSVIVGFLMAHPTARRKRLVALSGIIGASLCLVTAILFVDRRSGGTGEAKPLSEFLMTYTVGAQGYYGNTMTWGKAASRIAATSLIGLAPILMLLFSRLAKGHRREGWKGWMALLPLGMAIANMVGMRNYFAHHPWCAMANVIIGLMLSMVLIRGTEPSAELRPSGASWRKPVLAGTLLSLGVVYCLGVIMLLRANVRESDALYTLVWTNTGRHDVLVVSPRLDSNLAGLGTRLEKMLDRRFSFSDAWTQVDQIGSSKKSPGPRQILLTARRVENLPPPIAVSGVVRGKVDSWIDAVLDGYREVVARRNPGDRPDFDTQYYLYELPEGQR